MKKTNPAVFTSTTAHLLNNICDTVREAHMKGGSDCVAIETFYHNELSPTFSCVCAGQCHSLKRLARKAVAEWQEAVDCDSLRNVFPTVSDIVQHVVDRLLVETQLMKIPTQRANAVLCYRRAEGASYEELTKEFGYPESTLQGVFRRHTGFICYVESKLEEEYDYGNIIWRNLDEYWKRWGDGSLLPKSFKGGDTVYHKQDDKVVVGKFVYYHKISSALVQFRNNGMVYECTVATADLRFDSANF